jgi:hypothetical protein
VSNVIVVTRAMPGATRRTPSIAAFISLRSDIVLDPDEIDATGRERGGLLPEHVDRDLVVERPQRLDDLSAWSDVAGDEGRPAGGVHLRPSEDRGRAVQLIDPFAEAMQPEPKPVGAERVGQQDPRAGLEVTALDAPDDFGVGQVPDLGGSPNWRPLANNIVPIAPSARIGPCSPSMSRNFRDARPPSMARRVARSGNRSWSTSPTPRRPASSVALEVERWPRRTPRRGNP